MNQKLLHIIEDAAIVGAGAALTAISTAVSGADFGIYGPAVVAVLTTLVSAARHWLSTEQTQIESEA